MHATHFTFSDCTLQYIDTRDLISQWVIKSLLYSDFTVLAAHSYKEMNENKLTVVVPHDDNAAVCQ